MPLPRPLPKMTPAQIAAFWRHVDRSGGPDACWPWIGDHVQTGYGRFKVGRRELKPHRVALALTLGHDPGSAVTRHTCDTPPCCNPAHLLPGTWRDNTRDAKERGRLRAGAGARHGTKTHPESHAKGEASVLAKLTAVQVEALRRAYLAGGVTQNALAAQYGVTRETIGSVLRGKNWGHLTVDATAMRAVARRNRALAGERNPSARLTPDDVRAIRARATRGGVRYADLAAEYGVSAGMVGHIVRRRAWDHVT